MGKWFKDGSRVRRGDDMMFLLTTPFPFVGCHEERAQDEEAGKETFSVLTNDASHYPAVVSHHSVRYFISRLTWLNDSNKFNTPRDPLFLSLPFHHGRYSTRAGPRRSPYTFQFRHDFVALRHVRANRAPARLSSIVTNELWQSRMRWGVRISTISIPFRPSSLTADSHLILVVGTVYVDDEPYWQNLLTSNTT